MTAPPEHPLRSLLARTGGPALVLHDPATEHAVDGLGGDEVEVQQVGGPIPGAPRRWQAVVLVATDGLSLRRCLSVLPPLGRTRLVGWWLVDDAAPVLVVPRPEWPAVTAQHGRTLHSGGALTTLRTEVPVGAGDVLGQVTRTLALAAAGQHGVVVATTSGDPLLAPPADPGLLVVPASDDAAAPDRKVPPDVVLTADASAGPIPEHDIIARSPVVVSAPDLLAGPLDEGLLNPAGFRRHPVRGEVSLAAGREGDLRLVGDGFEGHLSRGEVTPATVAALRDVVGVRVDWGEAVPPAQLRAVAALAMAGVPLVSDGAPAESRLGPGLAAALTGPADLTHPLRREERSVLLRRAALLEYSTLAWRERLAAAAGIGFRRFPTCSAVIALGDPEQLDLALAQMNRQRGADLELIVVAHGFAPDEAAIRERSGHPAVVVPLPEATSSGQALAAGAAAAAGDLLVTMRAEDRYGPDFVADLLLARHYAHADLVGTPAEFVHLPQQDLTLRRRVDSERFAHTVARGTVMIGRSTLRELDGFRDLGRGTVRALVADVRRSGGRIYRSHGLGYVRTLPGRDGGWSPPEGHWLADPHVEERWDGYRPSRLLDPDHPTWRHP